MWSNWSGNQNSSAPLHRPSGETAIAQIIQSTQGVIRPVGSGHSFTPLIPGADHIVAPALRPDGPLISMQGDRVRADANATLKELSIALAKQGRAFRNLGDINVQTLAGATATATHGTGALLPCLAGEITGMRLVAGTGEAIEVSQEDLPGAQVALGLLGIVTEIEIATVPAYNLRRRSAIRPATELLDGLTEKWAAHRNYEIFLLPHSGKGITVSHDISDDEPGKQPLDLDELGLRYIRAVRHLRHISPGLRRFALGLLAAIPSDEDYVGESWQVLSKARKTRFNETEYHLPPDSVQDVLAEIGKLLATRHQDVWLPIEVRQTAGDTAWLSPFQHGPRVSVAVHMGASQAYEAFFSDCETIFRAAGGRPHWGKLHRLTRADLETLYPDLPKFDALRQRLDPKGRFMSPAMAAVFQP